MDTEIKRKKRQRRHKRVRAKIFGTGKVPRLCVFRSNKHIYAQLIDDRGGKTIISVSDKSLKEKTEKERVVKKEETKEKSQIVRAAKTAAAYETGKLVAKLAKEKKIDRAVFDRGGHKYHGRVRALAEGARDGGLKF